MPKKVTALTDYGTVTPANAVKDLFLLVKSSSPSGTYGAGTTRKAEKTKVEEILNYPRTVKLTIPVASVKTGNSVPILIIAAPGAGYAIDPISLCVKNDFQTVAYNGANGIVRLITDTGTLPHFDNTVNIITAGSDTFLKLYDNTGAGADMIENKAIKVKLGADHALGDGIITVYVTYQIIAV